MKIIACSIVSLLVMCAVTVAAEKSAGGDEAALRAIEAKWDAASLKGDTAAFGTIYADTFISTDTDGKVRTKTELLARMKAGEIKYLSAKAEDIKVGLYGDAAVVNGRWAGKWVEKGKNIDSTERFTDFFVRQNGQWRCVASQGSPIK